MIGLTPKQAQCLAVIERLTVAGMSPTFEQIRVEMGLVTKSAVHRLVGRLVERGHLRRIKHRARALEVVSAAVPSKTKLQIADEVCARADALERSGDTLKFSSLHAIVMEVLQ